MASTKESSIERFFTKISSQNEENEDHLNTNSESNKDVDNVEVVEIDDPEKSLLWPQFHEFFKFVSKDSVKKIFKVQCLNCVPQKVISVSCNSSYNLKKHLQVSNY